MKRYRVLAACVLSIAAFDSSQAAETPAYSGLKLYQQFCSSCHGSEAHGDGPVAPAMTGKVPDLTQIAVRNYGKFPSQLVRETIDGRRLRPAHGSADMPVWGWEFSDIAGDDGARRKRVDDLITVLVEYVRAIQQH
ncbi:MAG TPA: c-type cytochrome [Steroidobacteraceae bacterium]|nr:c-type cytochrome [Steroidobacteraceae bacterium]